LQDHALRGTMSLSLHKSAQLL